MKKPSLSELASNPSCMDDYDPNAMSVTQARAFIRQYLEPRSQTEMLALKQSLGRVLAEDIISPFNVPGHDNSAMDGIAFRHADADKPLKLVGTALAGKPYAGTVNSGECVKIMTGAMIPQGADTVEMQERVTWQGDTATLTHAPKQGQHIRLAGEDLANGQTVLAKGRLLRPADIGLIASLGIAEIACFSPLKVAFFSTGDELASIGQPLQTGQIYDSNRYTIYSMLERVGVETTDLGNVPDDPAKLEATLLSAAEHHDVIITSGGVSVGEADYMKALLAKHGQVLFWKINMKPGRPLAYGKVQGKSNQSAHYFGLPGNPVSTMVTFYQFVREALHVLMGAEPEPIPMLKAICTQPIKKGVGRTEFLRGVLYEENGLWLVKPIGNQSSGVLRSMSDANCFIVLAEGIGNCDAGSSVDVQLLQGMI